MKPLNIYPIKKSEICAAVGYLFSNKDGINELEESFSKKTGQTCLVVGSGKEAIKILLATHGLKKGDEILFPAYMCEQVARYLMDSGYILRFVDTTKNGFNIDPDDIQKKITKKTKAVIAVHLFGKKCEIGKIRNICKHKNIILIEDCAQLIEKPEADNAIFSMNYGKVLNSLGGGMISCSSKRTIERCAEIRGNLHKKNGFLILGKLLILTLIQNPIMYQAFYPFIVKRRAAIRVRASIGNKRINLRSSYSNVQASIALCKLNRDPKFKKNVIIDKRATTRLNSLRKEGIDAAMPYPYLPSFFKTKEHCPHAKYISDKLIIFSK